MSIVRQVDMNREQARMLILLARDEVDNILEAIGEVGGESPSVALVARAKADALEAAALKLYDAFGFTDNDFEVGPDGSLI